MYIEVCTTMINVNQNNVLLYENNFILSILDINITKLLIVLFLYCKQSFISSMEFKDILVIYLSGGYYFQIDNDLTIILIRT